ncbi:Saccharopine dehydrogenase, NADP-dependent [Sinosporangium album]|uniref:Saccharopine dehydrogenase, NADP-dependent n=2 Tax=Sinosporangium album TaxID=504805 RepID=A0A1G8I2S6_9ACTN|nr:saccharopine dehydrogenase NADP-binding domain-containing protein [Sinosporangium album]SDI13122.1 Saccharopine dehydrogenase, NADP-dependent [Sinosporangium album]
MNVVVLGAGHMGRYAAIQLAALPFVHDLVIGDLDEEGARSVAETLGRKARPAHIDATNRDQLKAVLEEADVVVSTVGPFFRIGAAVLDAAVQMGCHYVDICDDPAPTLELLSRDATAREAKVTAIVGAGASPGISNLLALKAIEGLEEIDTLITGWGTGGQEDDPEEEPSHRGASAAVEHWVSQLVGPIPIQDDGRQVQGKPMAPTSIRLPGSAPITAYTVGHPEPVTLPRYFPAIRHSINVFDMPRAVVVLLEETIRSVTSGRLSVSEASRQLTGALYDGQIGPGGMRGAVRAGAAAARERVTGKDYLPQIFALATGRRAGRRETRATALNGYIPGGMAAATCIPTTIMLTMLAEDEIDRRGVFAPEAGVDPDRFFARLAPHIVRDSTSDGEGPVRFLNE